MVSYDCPYCESGQQQVTTIVRGIIKTSYTECDICYGKGTLRNGKPTVGLDLGITDPDPIWKEKWGKDYAKERAKAVWKL